MYTLGAVNHRYDKNGTKLVELTNIKAGLTKLRSISIEQNRKKDNAIALLPYLGERGTYTPSNVFFIDIDTTEGVDILINNADKLFATIPNILFIQKSHSNKLHICCIHKEKYVNTEDWVYNTKLETFAAIELINKAFGIDYSTIEDGYDTHSFNWTALLYISSNEILFNDLCMPINLNNKTIGALKKKYEEFFVEKTIKNTEKIDTDGKYEDGENGERLKIDRDVNIGEWSGNDIRWRISRIADEIFGEDAKSWCDKHFYYENGKSIYSHVKEEIPISYRVLEWLTIEGYINIKSQEQISQTETNIRTITMEDDEWMSNYVPVILDYITKERVLTIEAPTGAGKTTMLNELVKSYREPLVLVPFNVTNALYKSMNIVSSQTDNEYKRGKANVMIWDQFIMNYRNINPDIIFIDESHTLFLDRSYRDSAIKTMNLLRSLLVDSNTRIVFVSATPTAEIQMYNSFVLKFIKPEKRDVKFEIHFANDAARCFMRDLRIGGFDRICVFSDRDAQLGMANAVIKGYDSTIYHSNFRDNVDRLRDTEMLDHKVSFLTCIAFNGLNIRNTGERLLIDIRYVNGETSLNEIIQIVGRFRRNYDITVRVYVDGKYGSDEDLEEVFEDAKTIIESDSLEVINDYWRRLNREDVQDALREIELFYRSQSIQYIVGTLKNIYKVKLYKDESKDGYNNTDPEKRLQSELFKEYILNNGTVDLNNKYIKEWINDLRKISEKYGVDAREYLKKLLGGDSKKSERLISTILNDLDGILEVQSFDDEGWEEQKKKRQPLIDSIKRSKLVKALMARFKKSDEWREKYKGWEIEDVIDDQAAALEFFFSGMQDARSKGGSVSKINNIKKITDGTNVWDSCKDASIALECGVNTITNRIKKGILWEC